MTRVRARHDLAALPVSAAITTRRKELSATDTVADARRLFARDSVRVLPVLDGGAYVGVVTRDALDDVDPETPVVALTSESVPVALAGTPSAAAFAALDRSGSTRLVVVEDDGVTYRGLVCLRTDRERVCVDAECHAEPDLPIDERNTLTTISPDTHVSALVLEEPGRARVFERFGIDYCCGGGTPLEEACAQRDLDVVAVIAALDESRSPEAGDVDWTAVPLSALADHIVEEHHAYLRQELPPLTALVEKVARAHGDVHAELEDVRDTFAAIAAELSEHMVKEEQIVFPACVALEAGNVGPGSIEAPIQVMVHEHDEVAAGLARLRELTTGYEPPADACNSYRAMLDRLQTLELDTHRHVHKENNVLFPRALALASGA